MKLLLTLIIALLAGCAALQPAPVAPVASVAVAKAATTRAVPIVPNSMTVPVGYNLTLSWQAVTTYTNGNPLTKTPTYKLYTYNPTSGVVGFVGYLGNVLQVQKVQSVEGQSCYELSTQVYDPNANEGPKTAPVCVLVQGTAPATPPVPGSPVCVK